MTSPEFRCLICDKVFAEGADPSLPRETCAQCGKATLMKTAVEEPVVAEVVPLVRPPEPPTVSPVKPPPIPDVFPRAKVVPTVTPSIPRTQAESFRPADHPEAERPKPKLAFALFVAFLTMLAIAAALTVVGYTIILGLKKAAKRVEVVPTVRVATLSSAPGGAVPR